MTEFTRYDAADLWILAQPGITVALILRIWEHLDERADNEG